MDLVIIPNALEALIQAKIDATPGSAALDEPTRALLRQDLLEVWDGRGSLDDVDIHIKPTDPT